MNFYDKKLQKKNTKNKENNDPSDLYDNNSFASLITDIKPLKKTNKEQINLKKKTDISQDTFILRRNNAMSDNDNFQNNYLSDHEPEIIAPDAFVSYVHSSHSLRILKKLKNGKFHVEYYLDLHGYTVSETTELLVDFFNFCKKKQLKCIQIIHGKSNKKYEENKVTLKSYVVHWLKNHINSVISFVSCPPSHGGTGAIWVLLKHNKTKGSSNDKF